MMNQLTRLSTWVGRTFALWAIVFTVIGLLFPQWFVGLKSWIVPVLGLIMFGMGLTLDIKDFAEIGKRPVQVLVGLAAQFMIMPLLALLLTKIFSLDPMIAVGVILVGCCPGGTSSNVITFLSRGDVALSVTITSFSTVLAPIFTPLLLELYAGTLINIDVTAMMWSIAKIVLLPVSAGLIVHHLLGDKVKPAINVLPLVSVSGIIFILVTVVALSQGKILESGPLIFFVVLLHNLLGYTCGFLLGRACGFGLAQQRTIMIEVGMQNSGLGVALASSYFSPLAALPSALFSIWHCISGALLANVCVWLDERRKA